jgi:hypothetical protein
MARAASQSRYAVGLAFSALLCLIPLPALGFAEAEGGCCSVEAMGNIRLLGAYLVYPDVEGVYPEQDDALLGSVGRLIFDGSLGEQVDYEVNLFNDLSRIPEIELGGAFATAGSFETPYRYPHLAWEYWRSGTVSGQAGVDRLRVRLDAHPVDLTAGRFPVSYSVTRIFTVNDFFAPFSATAINKIYKPGVDALRMGVALGMLSTAELLAVMGYTPDGRPDWGRSAVVARASAVLGGVDGALLGGKLAERWMVGASLQAELGPLALRGEGHAGFADLDGDFRLDTETAAGLSRDRTQGRLALGLEYPFAWHNSSVGLEYAFFSDGAASAQEALGRAARFFPDDLPYLGQHYLGLSLGGEIIPILYASLVNLFNLLDPSGLCALTLLYSIADEAEFVGGLFVPWGRKPAIDPAQPVPVPELRSELGAMPFLVFMETRFSF